MPKAEKGGKVINYDVKLEGTVHGGLVKVNPMEGIITIDASDASLLGQTFQVYITCHVETNKLVQDSYYDFIPTFEVTVSD